MENEKRLCKELRNAETPILRCLSDRWTHLCAGHDADLQRVWVPEVEACKGADPTTQLNSR